MVVQEAIFDVDSHCEDDDLIAEMAGLPDDVRHRTLAIDGGDLVAAGLTGALLLLGAGFRASCEYFLTY